MQGSKTLKTGRCFLISVPYDVPQNLDSGVRSKYL
jgi:hypothetical protein